MKCLICGKEVPLDFTQKVVLFSQGEGVCCATHPEEEIQNYLQRDKDCSYFHLIKDEPEGEKCGCCYGVKDTPYVNCQGNFILCDYNYRR